MSALEEAGRPAVRRTEPRFSVLELQGALWHRLMVDVEPALQLARDEVGPLSSGSPVLEPLLGLPAVQQAWASVLAVASDVRVYPGLDGNETVVFAFGGILEPAQLEAARLAVERLLAVLREALADAHRGRSMVAAGYRDAARDPSKEAESVREFDAAGRQALVDHHRELELRMRRAVASEVARRVSIVVVAVAGLLAFMRVIELLE